MTGHAAERVTLATLPSGVEVDTTIHTYEGAGDGPTVYLQAGQHGSERNGIEVLRRLHDRLDPAGMDGRVVAVPVANPLTFDRSTYATPRAIDGRNANLNRVWPGDPEGSVNERIAAALWERAREADAIVDLHDGAPETLPHVIFTDGDRPSRRLARAFGADLLLAEPSGEDAEEGWHARRFEGKLRVAASRNDVPTITPELGNARLLDEDAIAAGVSGVLAVLRELGVLESGGERTDGEREATADAASEPTVARNHLGRVTAEHSGLFRPGSDLELGQRVAEGRHLGDVYRPSTYERLRTVEADREGILYALTSRGHVVSGYRLAGVATILE